MKKILLIMTLMSASMVSISKELTLNEINPVEDFDAVFILSNSIDTQDYAKLDCQSYFQKLELYNSKDILQSENYITFGECEYIYKNFLQCMQSTGSKCINSQDILAEDCNCK